MKKLILFTVYCLLFTVPTKAQVNLVPNSSFEQLDSCPTYLHQISYAPPWFQTFVFEGNQISSSDLYSTCCNDNFCAVPSNFEGIQLPKTGNSYAGIILYTQPTFTDREYIETMLLDTLKSTTSYCVQFYISLGDNSKWAVSNIGAYFSNDSCLQIVPPYVELPYTPQVENTDTIIVKDKINWQRISLPYQAQGGERFMTIGNFYNHTNSNTMLVGGSTFYAYYYIDDVSVIDISTPAYAGVDTTIAIGDSIFIGRQPEIGLNDVCVWSVNGNPIDTVAGLWVMPDSTTTYILEQTICGYTTYDTVTVTILPTGIDSYSNKNTQFEVYPNPANKAITIKSQESIKSIFKLIDLTGKEILKQNITTNITQIDIQALPKGIYFYQITNKKEQYSGKLVVD